MFEESVMKQIVCFNALQTILNRATILATALALSACTRNQPILPITLQPIAAANLPKNCAIEDTIQVELDDVREALDDYEGQCFNVRETIGRLVGNHAFLLTDYHLFGGESVLIFNASGDAFTLPMEQVTDEVLAVGEVRQFTIADFERDYGFELDLDRYAEYENLPAIVAQSLFLSPDPSEAIKNPDAFADQVIVVAGEMDDRFTPNVFTLDEEQFIGGEDLLVIGTTAVPAFKEDDEDILAVGVLRQFDITTFEREYDLDWNAEVQQQMKAEYTNKLVFVAQAVYRAAD
jgi:hypothetical protein